jgi:PAS domain S-box-containing protein
MMASVPLLVNLRARLVALVLLALIPALALILFIAWEERGLETTETFEDAQRLVRLFSQDQERYIEGARQLLIALAQLPDVRDGNTRSCNALFANLEAQYPLYANFGAIWPDGKLYCSAVPFEGVVDLSDRSYFRRAVESRDFAIGDYQIGRLTKKPTLNFGYPVSDETGKIKAVVFAALDLGWLNSRVAEVDLPAGSVLSVIDYRGTVLARHPDRENWIGKSAPELPVFKTVLTRRKGTAQMAGADGVRRLYAFASLKGGPSGDAYVIVGIPEAAAFANVHRSLLRNLVWLGLVAVLALAAAWFIGNPFVVSYISERIRAQEARLQLAAIVESSDDAIIGKTLEGTITSWNRGAERIYGYAEHEIIGRSIATLAPPERKDEITDILERLKRGERIEHYETVRVRKDGKPIDVYLTVSPVSDASGKVTGLSTIARDITERKRLEQEANRLRADFTAMIIHDLRSPLTTIMSGAGMMEEGLAGPVNPDQKKWLGKIQASSRHMVDLISEFLDLSKIEAGRIELLKEEVDLHGLVKNCLDNYLIVARDKGVSLISSLSPELPRIWADPRRLEQVFANLVSNAIKFTPAGGKIEVNGALENGDRIQLSVSDTGPGIPPRELGQIFQKYRQTLSGKMSQHKGTGLGLVICKMIVEAHGGKIWVESQEGGGTAFFFSLPVASQLASGNPPSPSLT